MLPWTSSIHQDVCQRAGCIYLALYGNTAVSMVEVIDTFREYHTDLASLVRIDFQESQSPHLEKYGIILSCLLGQCSNFAEDPQDETTPHNYYWLGRMTYI